MRSQATSLHLSTRYGIMDRFVERSIPVDDLEVVRRISQLADEEHQLERAHAGTSLSDDELRRLREVEVALDQCWDLLRQRRARRGAGENPDEATVRSERTVEGYEQ
jgi:hypothetical protein